MGYNELRTIDDIADHAKQYHNSSFTKFFEYAEEGDLSFVFHGTAYQTDNPSVYFFVASFEDFDVRGDNLGQLFQVFMYHRSGGQVTVASNRFSTLRLAEMAALLLVDKMDAQYKPAPSKREIIPAWRPF